MIPNELIITIESRFKIESNTKTNMDYIDVYNSSSKAPSKRTIIKLLNSINRGINIQFFDNFHPHITDPGTYITVVYDGNNFLYNKEIMVGVVHGKSLVQNI